MATPAAIGIGSSIAGDHGERAHRPAAEHAHRDDVLPYRSVLSLLSRRRMSRYSRDAAAPAVDGLVVSGLAELAVGALTGWPYALAIASRERAQGRSASARARACASGTST
jgi:hypothetical protein